jgi:hypothetical protein
MQTSNNEKVIDINSFKQNRPQEQEQEDVNVTFKPMLVWYPMWVMVPEQPTPPAAS